MGGLGTGVGAGLRCHRVVRGDSAAGTLVRGGVEVRAVDSLEVVCDMMKRVLRKLEDGPIFTTTPGSSGGGTKRQRRRAVL
jgi:hypothetical protein